MTPPPLPRFVVSIRARVRTPHNPECSGPLSKRSGTTYKGNKQSYYCRRCPKQFSKA